MNVYEIVTNRMIEMIERDGLLPWQKPWKFVAEGNAPKNAISGKEYRGINFVILSMAGFASPYFVTFNQAKQLGGNVRKGEKGTPVVFWKFGTREIENPDTRDLEKQNTVLTRYYTVFNVEQCENLTKFKPAEVPVVEPVAANDACEAIIAKYSGRPDVKTGSQASYSPALDILTMPSRDTFVGSEEYYSTLFHEYVHSTGHKNRLNRQGIAAFEFFGAPSYSKEELIAEMGAAFLCAQAGIENAAVTRNSAAYLKHWIAELRGDAKLLVIAASQAQKAADWINGNRGGEKVAPASKPIDQMSIAELKAKIAAIERGM